MNTYRTHAQLSAAIRSQAQIREELESHSTSSLGRLLCLCRWLYSNYRVRKLIERLH